MRVETEARAVYCRASTSVEQSNTLTVKLSTVSVSAFRLGMLIISLDDDIELRFMVRFSKDGIVWGTPEGVDVTSGTPRVSSVGWHYMDDFQTITGLSTTQELFVEFGVMARNKSAGTEVQNALVVLRADIPEQPGRTVIGPRQVCCTKDNTDTMFFGLTPAIGTEGVGSHRATFETDENTGGTDVQLVAGYQTSEDGHTWSAATALGTARNTNGITYAQGFTATSWGDEQYVRYGAIVNRTTGTGIECCVGSVRIDVRP